MRHVIVVTKQQLELMGPERERDLCLRLARSEVQVIKVVGNGLVERAWRRESASA